MKFPKISRKELLFFAALFLFSFWLMWHTFDYKDSTIYIATKVWSDFSANIPLIRSFSWGNNFPPQDPLFAGEPTNYHILFYLLVGTLERIGVPLDFALNIPSALGFFAFLLTIYLLAKTLLKSRVAAVLSVIFTLFNGSLSFLEFFKNHPLSLQTPKEIFLNNTFPSFGPYDGKTVSAFWNLNIYTNQRHLAAAYALALVILILIIKSEVGEKTIPLKKAIGLGLLLTVFPFLHSVGFAMTLMAVGILFLLLPKQRRALFITLTIAVLLGLPQLFLMKPGKFENNFRFRPGYLIANNLTLKTFINYWFLNLGLGFLLIPLGFLTSNKLTKKVFLAFLSLFIIGNLFQFSPEMAANHKFFNLFIVVGNILIAAVVYQIWQKKAWGKIFALILCFFLTFSGIIDFFAVKNDSWMKFDDAPKDPNVLWIKENTPPQAVFLNSSYLYHPASLAGRQIFLGWPYFPWAGGLDVDTRRKTRTRILGTLTTNKDVICKTLKTNGIDFVALGKVDPETLSPNQPFWENNFTIVYNNPDTALTIYGVNKSCR